MKCERAIELATSGFESLHRVKIAEQLESMVRQPEIAESEVAL